MQHPPESGRVAWTETDRGSLRERAGPGLPRTESGLEGPRWAQDPLLDSSVCDPSVLLHSFQTKKGRQICANPEEAWVQEYIIDLKLSA